jgi:hypothetical protein
MSNTFGGDKSLTATTSAPPAGPKPFGGLDPALLSKLVAAKMAGQQQPAAAPQPTYAAPQQPTYTPQMGAQQSAPQREEPLIRTVADPFASPYTKMATGFDPGSRQERGFKRSDGSIQWEFDDIRPHGTSGGIIGGGAQSSLHPDEEAKANMRVANTSGTPNEAKSAPSFSQPPAQESGAASAGPGEGVQASTGINNYTGPTAGAYKKSAANSGNADFTSNTRTPAQQLLDNIYADTAGRKYGAPIYGSK